VNVITFYANYVTAPFYNITTFVALLILIHDFKMSIMAVLISKEQTNMFSYENNNGIENQKNIIIHLEEAIKHHQKAASYLETGNLHEAQISTIKANGQTEHALMGQKEIIKKYY
jgi:hypothetical protein